MFNDQVEKNFYTTLEEDERLVFQLFLDVRDGEVSPIEAFQKVRDLALSMFEEAVQ